MGNLSDMYLANNAVILIGTENQMFRFFFSVFLEILILKDFLIFGNCSILNNSSMSPATCCTATLLWACEETGGISS